MACAQLSDRNTLVWLGAPVGEAVITRSDNVGRYQSPAAEDSKSLDEKPTAESSDGCVVK